MSYTTLDFEVQGSIARIRLNRPEATNALNATMARDLRRAVEACASGAAIRCVVITGAGKGFCGGGDLKAFVAVGDDVAGELSGLLTDLHAAILGLTRLDAPVIAAVNGVAAGAGMSLASACDLVIAAASARFTLAYTRAGLTPDGSATYFLPRKVGFGRTMELLLTNRMLTAEDAYAWGLVNRVVPDEQLHAVIDELAAQLAAGPTSTFGAAKRLLRDSWTATLSQQLEREAETIARIAGSADAREGMRAFVEKRPPRFTGA